MARKHSELNPAHVEMPLEQLLSLLRTIQPYSVEKLKTKSKTTNNNPRAWTEGSLNLTLAYMFKNNALDFYDSSTRTNFSQEVKDSRINKSQNKFSVKSRTKGKQYTKQNYSCSVRYIVSVCIDNRPLQQKTRK